MMPTSSRWLPLLLAAALLAVAGCGDAPPASLILTGGTVRTLDAEGTARAVALRGDTVVAVGSRAEVDALRGPDTRYVELERGTVLPAFVDHHVHVMNLGLALLNRAEEERYFMDLSSVASLGDLAERVAGRAARVADGAWVLGQGWSQAAWGTEALPDSDVLDRAAPRNPVFLTRIDAHAGWANGRALAAAGLDEGSPDPDAGRMMRASDGSLTGVLLERAVEPVLAEIPLLPTATLTRAFRAGARELAASGVTVAYDAGFLAPPGIVDLGVDFGARVAELAADDTADPLPVRIQLMIPAPSPFAAEVLGWSPGRRAVSPNLTITHLKLFADGALGSRGAALSHAYADDTTTHGVPRMSEEQILEWSRRAVEAGLDVATHAIGDAAVATALNAYGRLLAERPGLDPMRLRIEHFSYASAGDFRRAVELGVPLSIQSGFNSPPGEDPTFGEMRVGRQHGDAVYAWDRLDRMGAVLVEGSDFYALPAPPLFTLHAALTAQGAVGVRGGGPAGRLDALRLATRYLPPGGGAPRPGVLAVGSTGGLMVLSGDPLSTPLDSLLDVRVLLTVRGGRVVYDGR